MSPDIPLLANLSILENVSLVQEFHQKEGLSRQDMHALIALLKLDKLTNQLPSSVSSLQRFQAKTARALMLPGARLTIDRPFDQVGHITDISAIWKLLTGLEPFFQGCTFLDYRGNEKKYDPIVQG